MSVCFINKDYENSYKCEYEIKDGQINIVIFDYDIMDEVEAVNGIKHFGSDTKFSKRDILLIDYKSKRNILAKNAVFAGMKHTYGTYDGGENTKFLASVYFEHSEVDALKALPETPKVKKIKVYSKSLLDWVGTPSLKMIREESLLTYKLSREKQEQSITLNQNGIKQITLSDIWSSSHSFDKSNITIDFTSYIEIELLKQTNFSSVIEHMFELQVFMQLYCPETFFFEKVKVLVKDTYFNLFMPWQNTMSNKKKDMPTTGSHLLDFLKTCYSKIPYRNGKSEIRNIPYIVLKPHRGLEDNFLMFYRFIECYYKKSIPDKSNKFVSLSISEHYKNRNKLSEEEFENLVQEIICLRNHYAHSGYYIRNSCLRIKFEPINRKSNPRNYTVNNVNVDWIYERTFILYQVVIDIIYKNMLGYDNYRFTKHF